MWQLRRKLPYSQEEVAEQIGQISDLMKMRDRVNQPVDETRRLTDAIAVSQEVLAYMLSEISDGLSVKDVV